MESGNAGLLFDVGRSAKQIETALRDNNLDVSKIAGIFITHEHSDHIKGLRVFTKHCKIPVFCTAGTRRALEQIPGAIDESTVIHTLGYDGVECAGMFVKPFRTSHDANESCGYTVCTADNRRASICTDLGYVSDEVKREISGSDLVLIESNHDIMMLENGRYPYVLKRRIMSDIGHLSNEACAVQVSELVSGGTTRVYLAHLSKENNMPPLAYQTSVAKLTEIGAKEGFDYILEVAPRENEGKVVVF